LADLDGSALVALVESALVDGVFSAASLRVVDLRAGRALLALDRGSLWGAADAPRVTPASRYDLASLTKLVTSTVALRLVAAGALDLDRPVADLLGGRLTPDHAGITPRHLLAHTSGLPAWAPLWERGDVQQVALGTSPVAPPGAAHVYSDLGFLWLGAALEVAGGAPLALLARAEVLDPLAMEQTRYHRIPPSPADTVDVVATEVCPRRGLLVGEVSDNNTWFLGGVAPHAGLFGPADDLARFAQGWFDAGRTGYLPVALRDEAWGDPPLRGGHVLGWDTPAPEGYTSVGRELSPRSHGHLAFTGPSLWIDPERAIAVIFLCNRIHPSREEARLRPLRPALHDAVARAVDAVQ
jgi:CubicO group peptidase (beta-lactamase class C family)